VRRWIKDTSENGGENPLPAALRVEGIGQSFTSDQAKADLSQEKVTIRLGTE